MIFINKGVIVLSFCLILSFGCGVFFPEVYEDSVFSFAPEKQLFFISPFPLCH